MSSAKNYKQLFTTTLKALLAIALIYWLTQSGKLSFSSLKVLLSPVPFSVCFILIGLNLFLVSERWYQILMSQDIHTNRWMALKMSLIGVFFNFVVPGGVGGDVIKGYYIAKNHPQERMKAVVTVAMDRLVGLYTMILMAVAVMVWDYQQISSHPQLATIFYLLLALGIGFSFFWMIIFSQRLSSIQWIHSLLIRLPQGERFQKMFLSFAHYSKSKHIIFKTFFISLAAQIFSIFMFVAAGNYLGFQDVSIHTYFYVVPIGGMVTAVPISPAGVGVGQAAFYYLFSLVLGKETPLGSLVITTFQIFLFLYGLIGALFYVMIGKRENRAAET